MLCKEHGYQKSRDACKFDRPTTLLANLPNTTQSHRTRSFRGKRTNTAWKCYQVVVLVTRDTFSFLPATLLYATV